MVINKKVAKKSAIKASNARVARRRAIRASEEEVEEVKDEAVDIAPEASDLLFEAEDVAELIAEVTGKDVAVTAEDDTVVFEIGDDQYTVEAEGEEEILESSKKALRGKKPVSASRKVAPRRTATAARVARRR